MINNRKLFEIILKYTNKKIPENIYKIYDNSLDLEEDSLLILYKPVYILEEKYKNNIISHTSNLKPLAILFIDGSEKLFEAEIKMNIFSNPIYITNEVLHNIINEYYFLQPKEIIGVTGSCGKTSTSSFIYSLLEKMNVKSLLIGTMGIKGIKKNLNIRNTTPSWVTLKRLLHESVENDINIAIIEVSSHGIGENRIRDIDFTSGIWTHFIEDHLEYHKTIEKYFECKNSFIEKLPIKIINENVNNYKEHLKIKFTPTYYYGRKTNFITDNGFNFLDKKYEGEFNVKFYQQENLVGAMILLYEIGYKNVFNYMSLNINIKARMELIGKTTRGALIYNDDAYRWNNIEEVINYFVPLNLKRLILVIGAGGDRYRGEDYRKNIGALSKKISKLIVCDVNPRNENPIDIRNEIIGKDGYSNNIINIGNRFEALMYAFETSKKDNIVLILPNCVNNMVIYKNYYTFMSDADIYNHYMFYEKINKNFQNLK
jgi:UDP-N-acetylmuramoyl-L-alanyl-D-glutamate--2,6-diaminopimelate ligase